MIQNAFRVILIVKHVKQMPLIAYLVKMENIYIAMQHVYHVILIAKLVELQQLIA